MPYVKKEKRLKMLKNPASIGDVGDLNFAYSMTYIVLWNSKPSYSMIEIIAGIGWSQEYPQFIEDIDAMARKKGFSVKEIIRAKLLSFNEFMRRVGNNYEDAKIAENGDIYTDVPFADDRSSKAMVIGSLVPKAKQRGRKKING